MFYMELSNPRSFMYNALDLFNHNMTLTSTSKSLIFNNKTDTHIIHIQINFDSIINLKQLTHTTQFSKKQNIQHNILDI